MARLEGKRTFITGGTTGIGLATAKLFLDEGAEVAVIGQNAERVDEARRVLGNRAIAIRADVTKRAEMDAAIAQVVEAWGGIDVVFANAGIAAALPFEAADDAHVTALFDVNVKGVINTVQAAVPHLQSPASVILTGSAVSDKAGAGLSVYGATKAAVRSLARSLSAELSPRGIRVNVLSPGPTQTPIFGKLGMPEDAQEGMLEQFRQMVPAGRFAASEEMARAALYLASDDSSYMLGGNLLLDGGYASL